MLLKANCLKHHIMECIPIFQELNQRLAYSSTLGHLTPGVRVVVAFS